MVSSANLVSSGPFSQGSHEFPACLVVLHHLSREVVIEVPGSGTRGTRGPRGKPGAGSSEGIHGYDLPTGGKTTLAL